MTALSLRFTYLSLNWGDIGNLLLDPVIKTEDNSF